MFSKYNGIRLEIKISRKKFLIWKLSNILLSMVKEKITREIRKCSQLNDNEITTFQSQSDAAKAVLGGTFIALNAYLEKKKYLKLMT